MYFRKELSYMNTVQTSESVSYEPSKSVSGSLTVFLYTLFLVKCRQIITRNSVNIKQGKCLYSDVNIACTNSDGDHLKLTPLGQ